MTVLAKAVPRPANENLLWYDLAKRGPYEA
jgi:hypothetical protein